MRDVYIVCVGLLLIGFIGLVGSINPGLAVFSSIIIIVVLIAMMKKAIKKTIAEANQKKEAFIKNRNPLNLAGINVGKYLTGLPSVTEPVEMFCFVTATDFLFIRNAFEEVGKIPRDAVNNIGVFSHAAPKKKKIKEYCLLIDWDDENGNRSNTVFEFSEQNALQLSNVALNELKKHILPKTARISSTEKKCHYCAEIIKREAKVCRFCNRDV